MTLNEAIEKYTKLAMTERSNQEVYNKNVHLVEVAVYCGKKAEEYGQLAKWLSELEILRRRK